METNKDAILQSSSSVHAMDTRSKTKYQKESKSCSPNNDSAASTEQIMTLHPQEMKGFSFEKCLTYDDDQSNMGSKTHKHTKSRVSTSSSKSSIKYKHSSKSSSSSASSSVKSLKMKKIQLEVRLKSQKEINDLERKHADERYVEEQRILKKQQEEQQKNLQQQQEEQQKILQQRWAQESQERRRRIEMEDARLQAELSETIATIEEGKPETKADSDSKLISIARTRNNVVENKPVFCDVKQSGYLLGIEQTQASDVVNRSRNTIPRELIEKHCSNTLVETDKVQGIVTKSHFKMTPSLHQNPATVSSVSFSNCDASTNCVFTNSNAYVSKVNANNNESASNILPPVESHQKRPFLPLNFHSQNVLATCPRTVNVSAIPEPLIFDGHPANYCSFVDSFDTLICPVISDAKQRLFYLLKYTKGVAHTLVKGCQYMPSPDGYNTARKLLQENFGKKFQIAKACVDKILIGPPLNQNNKPSLIAFSAELTACMCTLSGMNYLHKIDNMDIISKIVKRLPPQWYSSWLCEVDKVLHELNQELSIEHLNNFVSIKTRQCTNLSLETPRSNTEKSLTKKTTTFTTTTVSKTQNHKCPLCNSLHFLNQCRTFRGQTYEQRLKYVQENHLCFSCLNPGHFAKTCQRKEPCRKEGCKKQHTTLLHPPKLTPSSSQTQTEVSTEVRNGFVETEHAPSTLLPIVPVKVQLPNSDQPVVTHAFLDNGSTTSFVTESLLRKLKVNELPEIDISTTTLTDSNKQERVYILRGLEIMDMSQSDCFTLNPLYSTKGLPVSSSDIPKPQDIVMLSDFDEIWLPDVNADVGLLIGNDNPHALCPIETLSTKNGYYAIKTRVGWIVNCPNTKANGKSCANFFAKSQPHPLCIMCSDVIDSITNEKPEYSINQQNFMNSVSNSIKHLNNKHYEIELPLKNLKQQLPHNKTLALQRASSLKRKLLRDNNLLKDYQVYMSDLITNGYAKLATGDGPIGKTWYIPHHGIYHPEKPGKLRVVFDCSAKYKGICLNDILLQGPDITNNLVGVLLRFRRESIAVQGDIQSMFHQVKIPLQDQDYFRFLWWKDGDLRTSLQVYKMTVYIFGTVCSPACANFALKRTAEDHAIFYDAATIEAVNTSFYVDDCLASLPTIQKAQQLVRELTDLLSQGGFRIRKWISNSREVIESIPKSDRCATLCDLDLFLDHLPTERALGLSWNVNNDTLCFKTKIKDKPKTRRGILSIINSLYDPLGFGVPVIQPFKTLMQRLGKLNLDWDEPIPDKELKLLERLFREFDDVSSFKIPRCYKPFGVYITNVQIHHFSDASEQAYGYVSYVRLTDDTNHVHCKLLFAKCKLAPNKKLTVPRLELCAATLSVSSERFLRRELRMPCLDESVFWTDSVAVLRYLRCTSKAFHTFVANRVSKIRDGSCISQWHFVPTKQNPADRISRGMTVRSFLSCNEWIEGPSFLSKPKSKWPVQPDFVSNELDTDPEVKQSTCNTVALSKITDSHIFDVLFDKYSDWHKLVRLCCWLIRCKRKWQSLVKRSKQVSSDRLGDITVLPLSLEELTAAKRLLSAHVQSRAYEKEIQFLRNGKQIPRSSNVRRLDPKFIDGLLCVGGRLSKARLSETQKHPVLLPHDHPIARLILFHIHNTYGHCGREHVLSVLRENLWITKANSVTRKIISQCFDCRKRTGKPLSQKMADIPTDRLTPDQPPFTCVGCDFFGHFVVKQARKTFKRFGVLFTCLTTRAIHIEIAESLDTSSFIMALRRFCARRGQVSEIRSDNGTNFVGGERELRESIQSWNHIQIQNHLLQKNIKWIFNPPGASHFGGVWERQIRTIRKILLAVCREQRLTDESLHTFMCEVEFIINSRPLTKSSDDPNDLEALTPNHLLLMKSNSTLPPGVFCKSDVYSRKRWRQVQYLADLFWTRWIKEFLPALQFRNKWQTKSRNLTPGDVVLIVDNTPRNTWLMGRVVQVFPDAHGFVRSVEVQTKYSIVRRPISKLCLIVENDIL